MSFKVPLAIHWPDKLSEDLIAKVSNLGEWVLKSCVWSVQGISIRPLETTDRAGEWEYNVYWAVRLKWD